MVTNRVGRKGVIDSMRLLNNINSILKALTVARATPNKSPKNPDKMLGETPIAFENAEESRKAPDI
jgi:hypothetical protein